MNSLFITGGSGFIGHHLIEKINRQTFDRIYCLSRTGELPGLDLSGHENIKVVKGDLLDVDSYAEFLASSDIVLHLAAVTGKATPEAYFDVNAEGTRLLVQQCERCGVSHFLHVSTIATKFPDISSYYYAQSKKAGEDAVKRSSLKYSIVKPTLVIGKDGPIWLNLAKLAKGPFPLIFGDGRTKIQPIYVEDLTNILVSVIENQIFTNGTYDLGGPETIPFEDFIQWIHLEYRGKTHSLVRLPLGFLLKALSKVEKYFYFLLPINTGQLSPFIYDSVAKSNPLRERHALGMNSPKEMIRMVVDKEKEDLVVNKLYHECKVFCRYLLNMKPSEYISKKYSEAHKGKNKNLQYPSSPFDRFLIRFGQWNLLCTKLVDSYTRVFSKRSIFRKKLVLLLAILESVAPYHKYLDSVDSCSRTKLFAALLVKLSFFVFYLALSTLVLAPLHIVFVSASKLRSSSNSTATEEVA